MWWGNENARASEDGCYESRSICQAGNEFTDRPTAQRYGAEAFRHLDGWGAEWAMQEMGPTVWGRTAYLRCNDGIVPEDNSHLFRGRFRTGESTGEDCDSSK